MTKPLGTKSGSKLDQQVAAAKQGLAAPRVAAITPPPAASALSTGCTLLNLACSGSTEYALHAGQYFYFVGDSGSGKTMLVLQLFAEAAANPFYDKHQLIYDNVENGALMNVEQFFGARAAARIQPPSSKGASSTIEEFYYNADTAFAKPCIYILDSMDGLTSKAAAKKFQEQKKAHGTAREKELAGSYGDGKAKANSEGLRPIVNKLVGTNSILVIISQTRDNIDAGLFESKKTRAGGHALTFYAHLECWTSTAKTLKKQVNKRDRQIGIICRCAVKKNRVNGRQRTVDVPIYPTLGVDEVGSMVHYLIAEGRWPCDEGVVTMTDFVDPATSAAWRGTIEKAVVFIETHSIEADVRQVCQEVWDDVERKCAVTRKPRYT